MRHDADVLIIGSGPAGVSAAHPLLQAGLKVLMLDGGRQPGVAPPQTAFLQARGTDAAQWKWMIGDNFHALRNLNAVSPKLRVPTHSYVFDGFAGENRIAPERFVAVGSLAAGGLSNAWGCGVARLSPRELAEFPFRPEELTASYERVTRRMGVSGADADADAMSAYFGLDGWTQPALPMDRLHSHLHGRYASRQASLAARGFLLGRSRVAALSRDHGVRKACDLSGNCLYGCANKALYSAADELAALAAHPNFAYRPGFVAEQLSSDAAAVTVRGTHPGGGFTFTATKVFLAAGTLASTGLALRALQLNEAVAVRSSPTAAFLLWLPSLFGTARQAGFGLGQLSFALALDRDTTGFGSTFSTTGIPLSEFVGHMPLRRRYGVTVLRHLLSSCLVGNIFLPGELSRATARLAPDGTLRLQGGYSDEVAPLMGRAERALRHAYWQLGALLLPKSFTLGPSGGDIHYAGTLPMRRAPQPGQSGVLGELAGLANVHAVDGASLSSLSEKSHTLTIMANADRIGGAVAAALRGVAAIPAA